jgi:hypothetical protein
MANWARYPAMSRSKIHAKTRKLNIFAGAPSCSPMMNRIFADFLGECDKIVI